MSPLPRLAALALAATLHATGCRARDEDVVAERIRAAMTAANARDAAGVFEDVAPGFEGPRGADARESRAIVAAMLRRPGWLRVFELRLQVQVEGDRADAEVEVVLAAGREVERLEDLLPTDGDVVVFSLRWERRGRAWLLVGADHRRAASRP